MSDPHIDTLLARRRAALGHPTPLFYDEPLNIVRGDGVWLYDHTGRRYLDVYNNVPHIGHCHPRVVQALSSQAAVLNVHTRYLHENVIRYGERLTATFDASLSTALFVCTGSEANELALRIARHHTGQRGVIVSDFCYHGNTAQLAGLATGIQTSEGFAPHARAIRIPDVHRDRREGESDEALSQRFLAQLDEAIDSLQAAGHGVSALLLDTMFSTEGLLAPPAGYLAAAVERVRAAGGLFIADEVQPGFGRTGQAMWGHQVHGVVPDFVTLGKPIGNGHPMAATITRPGLANPFLAGDMFFNTFGGNPVSAAVGLAVLDVLQDDHLVDNARNMGDYLQERLQRLAQRHAIIGRVRGQGLFFGLELVKDRSTFAPATAETRRLVNDMKRRGVLISSIGPDNNVLKMRPPMVFQREHADHLLEVLEPAIAAL